MPVPLPGGASLAAEPEAAYYQTIEEFFVSCRGDPLFLSNADWVLIRKWRRAGVPLRIVLRGIADALDGHAHSWGRARKVGSLAYCAAEVERARDRWRRALRLGEEPGVDAGSALAGFASALDAAPGLGPRGAAAARELAGELRARVQAPGDELEEWLSARERGLVDALRADAGHERVAALEAEVDADLGPYRARMPARVLAHVRAESVTRRLLAAHGLPRLGFLGA
jgi:hypothetical protein